ncbi:MAG: hypothetical protein WC527_07220 [Candidatus Margulisiibacteriota bacterium]
MSIFEVVMLLCFGAAWPFSIRKSLITGQNAGKSLRFLIIVFIGYVAGIIHKLLYSRDIVTVFYFLNASMVLIDIFIFMRNARRISV